MLAVTTALVLAACGVSQERSPKALDKESVPFDLLAPAVTSTTVTSTTVRAQPVVGIEVFLMGAERLQPVRRQVTAPVSARKAIEVLFSRSVSDAELAAGLRSAINPNVDLLSVEVSADVATVDLGENFLDASTQEQRVALAQIVFTATGVAGTAGVRFTLEGESREVPTDQGTQTGPLNREAFAQLAPLPPPPAPEQPPPEG